MREECPELVISKTFLLEEKFIGKRRYNKRMPIIIFRFLSRPTTSQEVLLISVKSISKLLKNANHFPKRNFKLHHIYTHSNQIWDSFLSYLVTM